jgi:hypothetical protein
MRSAPRPLQLCHRLAVPAPRRCHDLRYNFITREYTALRCRRNKCMTGRVVSQARHTANQMPYASWTRCQCALQLEISHRMRLITNISDRPHHQQHGPSSAGKGNICAMKEDRRVAARVVNDIHRRATYRT